MKLSVLRESSDGFPGRGLSPNMNRPITKITMMKYPNNNAVPRSIYAIAKMKESIASIECKKTLIN